jgi:polysaccharide deacetylase 2 family uncharacterized protein YibQ
MAKRTSKRIPGLGTLAVVLIVLIAVGVAAVRYVRTPPGEALLLDLGLGVKYDAVQKELDRRIVQALLLAGVDRKQITIQTEKEPGERRLRVVLNAVVPNEVSLIEVNSLITRSVKGAGGKVHSCIESGGGRIIEMEVGTRRHVTHSCIIKKRREPKREPGVLEPVIALIVDDFGYFYNKLVKDFLTIEIPVTVTVIPGLGYSEEICEAAASAGKEVLCHLPMEPERGAADAGEIPLVRVGMSEDEIRRTVERSLETTPGIVGINNHMGSRATADRNVMDAVVQVCRRRGLFFIDSMTTQRSVVREAAKRAGVPTLSNDLFIDNAGEDPRENMEKIISIARRKGYAVGIMHLRRGTLKELRWMIGEAERAGVKFVTVSDMISRQSSRR